MDWRSHIARYGQGWFPGEGWVRITALVLLALAAILRFYRLHELPFTHDELSALVRLYPTLGETLQRGVVELDTHPPGVQVFEWLWTRAFGISEFAVKLPFVLMSLAALFLFHRFALAWTSAPTALITLSFLATMQFSVMYGQIARPYAAGFFTTALLADQLTRHLAFGHRRALIGLGLAAVLCAYTHHFTLMLAAAMIPTGFLLIHKEQRKAYLIMCTVSVVLYLPNIPIFLTQLGLGGLDGWLTAPNGHWIVEHLTWLVHFSPLLGSASALLVSWSLVRRFGQRSVTSPASWFLPIWGLLPLVVGFAYSVLRSPVLQYSMLLFGFPFVLMALFSGLRGLPGWLTRVLCSVIVVLAVYTLVVERQHYTVFYASRYEAMMEAAVRTLDEQGAERTLVLFDAPRPQIDFYLPRYPWKGTDLPYVNLRRGMTTGQLDSLLAAARPDRVVLGISNGAAPEDPARVQAHMRHLRGRQDLVEGQVYEFGRYPMAHVEEDRTLLYSISPGQPTVPPFSVHQDLPIQQDSTGQTWWLFDDREFGVECTFPLPALEPAADDLLEVVADVYAPAPATDFAVILELQADGRNLLYKGGDLNSFMRPGPVTLVAAASRNWVLDRGANVQLKAYIHNRSKGPVRVGSFTIYRRRVDPVQNALFEPIRMVRK